MIPRRIAAWLFFSVGLALAADLAEAGGARLYEITENMKLMIGGGEIDRIATAQLLGFADPGTPLCPPKLASPQGCVVNATGEDVVNLGNGKGTVSGRFTIVVQDDNPVDGPERVALRGRFEGTMDFSPALFDGTPYGTLTGHFKLRHQTFPFSGTFRLPFVVFVDPETGQPCDPTAHAPCVQTPPLYLDLAQPGSVVEVGRDEYAIGFATVRFDVGF
jgi:hypothetical protein